MIIRSSKHLKNYKTTQSNPIKKITLVENSAVKKEEIKPVVNNEVVYKKKNNKKITPTPVVEKPVEEVIEEEKIDLSEWLKDEIEE